MGSVKTETGTHYTLLQLYGWLKVLLWKPMQEWTELPFDGLRPFDKTSNHKQVHEFMNRCRFELLLVLASIQNGANLLIG